MTAVRRGSRNQCAAPFEEQGEHDKAIAHERPIHQLSKVPRPKRLGETGVHFVKSDFANNIVTAMMSDLVKKRARSRTNCANR